MTEKKSPNVGDFSKVIQIDEVKSEGTTFELTAAPSQCNEIAVRLGVLSVDAATGLLTIKHQSGAIEITGELKASLKRECVVSLEPMEETVTDKFTIRFYADEQDLIEADEIDDDCYTELLDGDSIHLGEVLIQQISLAMNPHPRKTESGELVSRYGREDLPSPFAALKQFSTERDD
jgi:uncharacterized metal-binding protein YceD (DUF177 family)